MHRPHLPNPVLVKTCYQPRDWSSWDEAQFPVARANRTTWRNNVPILNASSGWFKTVILPIYCFLGLTLFGAGFNALENWTLKRRHPTPGDIYTIEGHTMHVYCTGEGSPTVILESGLGNDWLVWQLVQPVIARTHRVCSYDRAGLGWSAPQPGPRGAIQIAHQLRQLLDRVSIHDKLILVGHSAGGLYVRAFAGLFPDRVAGLVFVDASSPEAFHALPSPALRKRLISERHRLAPWLFLKVATGWARLSGGGCNPNISERIPAVQELAKAEGCRPRYVNSWLGEWDDFESSAEQVFQMQCCSATPLVVVSADSSMLRQDNSLDSESQHLWGAAQEKLMHLSSKSMRVIARGSQHYVMVDRPQVVIDATILVDAEIHNLPGGIQVGETIWR